MSMEAASNQLKLTWMRVRSQWEQTSQLWNDSMRNQFAEQFWAPVEDAVPPVLQQMERFAQTVKQASQSVH